MDEFGEKIWVPESSGFKLFKIMTKVRTGRNLSICVNIYLHVFEFAFQRKLLLFI